MPSKMSLPSSYFLCLTAGALYLSGGILFIKITPIFRNPLLLNVFGISGISIGLAIILLLLYLRRVPEKAGLIGTVVTIISICGVFAGWGLIIGMILGVFGGLNLRTWTPLEIYCQKCGNEVPTDSKYCPVCGNRIR